MVTSRSSSFLVFQRLRFRQFATTGGIRRVPPVYLPLPGYFPPPDTEARELDAANGFRSEILITGMIANRTRQASAVAKHVVVAVATRMVGRCVRRDRGRPAIA